MPYPTVIFNNISEWESYINTYIITNGNNEIEGVEGNNAYNGAVKFIRQSPLNWQKASVVNTNSDTTANTPVIVFTGLTPSSLTFGDNIYYEYLFLNMLSEDIPLFGSLVYYNMTGQAIDYIPANTAISVFKATNDLWVQGSSSTGGGRWFRKNQKVLKWE
jgi:hypothetical protein